MTNFGVDDGGSDDSNSGSMAAARRLVYQHRLIFSF